jgi:hypothetical protein
MVSAETIKSAQPRLMLPAVNRGCRRFWIDAIFGAGHDSNGCGPSPSIRSPEKMNPPVVVKIANAEFQRPRGMGEAATWLEDRLKKNGIDPTKPFSSRTDANNGCFIYSQPPEAEPK